MRTPKRELHMSAAPAYIVYGHRHAVRLMSRLIAIILLLAAIGTVFFGIVWRSGSDFPPTTRAAPPHGGAGVAPAVASTDHASTPVTGNGSATTTPPGTKPKKH